MPNTLLFIFFPQNGFSSVQPTPLQTTQAVEGESASAVDVLGLLYCWDSVLWMKSFTWPNRKSFPCWTKCCHSHFAAAHTVCLPGTVQPSAVGSVKSLMS